MASFPSSASGKTRRVICALGLTASLAACASNTPPKPIFTSTSPMSAPAGPVVVEVTPPPAPSLASPAPVVTQAAPAAPQSAPAAPDADGDSWGSCVKQGELLDIKARKKWNPAKYRASARVLAGCVDLEDKAPRPSLEDRMRTRVMAVQNFLKGGDLHAARGELSQLQADYPGRDFYDADGNSVLDNLSVLLAAEHMQPGAAPTPLNVTATLKEELNRVRYWRSH